MYHHMYGSWGTGWDWLWMTFMMLVWLVVVGGIVYAVVRAARSHQRAGQDRNQRPLQP